jgi:hypothetical protein
VHTWGMFLAEVLAPSTVVQFPAGTLVATVVSLMGTGALALWYLATRLTRLEERMATKVDVASLRTDVASLATKTDVTSAGDRLDRRVDEVGKEVHLLGERVAGLEGAVGYARQRAL